jgi:hypothetical protein
MWNVIGTKVAKNRTFYRSRQGNVTWLWRNGALDRRPTVWRHEVRYGSVRPWTNLPPKKHFQVKIKNETINLGNVHFVGLYCIITYPGITAQLTEMSEFHRHHSFYCKWFWAWNVLSDDDTVAPKRVDMKWLKRYVRIYIHIYILH